MDLTTKELYILAEVLEKTTRNQEEGNDNLKELHSKIESHLKFEREKVRMESIKFFELVDNSILPSRKIDVCNFYDAYAHETEDVEGKVIKIANAKTFQRDNFEKMEGNTLYVSWLGSEKMHEVFVEEIFATDERKPYLYFQIILRPTGKYYLTEEK